MLRIAMTAADIPRTLGQPDQGFEGNRFTGLTMYDALTGWDLSSADKASVVIPGLATEWKVDDADKTKWTFKLRPGVTFHDGSPFNADAVVWNVEKVLKQDAPQFDASQVGVTASRMPTLASAKKVDDMTVELTTKEPDSFLPINLTNLFMASPAKWQAFYDKAEGADAKAKSQAAWTAFAKDAAGTGPWKMAGFTPRERLELVKNASYWNKDRVPKVDKMVLLPMPEANARTAALLSGQVDWVEAPAPDALPELKQRGFKLYANEQPHVWPWQFSRVEGSPWNDIRVRKAANLCVDREGLKDGLLAGLMVPATGTFEVGHPWRGRPDLRDQVRQGCCTEADAGGRIRPEQEADGEDPDVCVRLGPDAAVADERIYPAGAGRMLFRRAARCHRVEYAVHQLAPRRQGSQCQRLERDQRHLCGDGPVLRAGALPAIGHGAAGLEQLGFHQQSQIRRAGEEGAADLRSRRA
ncbi:peptide/nickel transport system substrate-binding protein [Bradyrhizobium sp. GM7.3]